MLVSEPSAYKRKGDFEYEPLPHPITHIRLLEILPVIDNQDITIQCRLRCVRLVDYDQCYTALSYTWNHDEEERPIWINGRYLNVKSNLYDFLYSYRQKLKAHALPTVFLWIDALCLNYTDVRERNSQVQIVPSIFQKAKTVLAWLEPLPGSRSVAEGRGGVRRFVDFLGQLKNDLERSQSLYNDTFLGTKYLPAYSVTSSFPFSFSDQWKIMLEICEHRYWTRLWILLENRFAQNLMFMYEDQLWSWLEFRAPFVLIWYMTKSNRYASDPSRKIDPTQILYSHAADIIQTRLVFEQPEQVILKHREATTYNDFATERWHLTTAREPLSVLLKIHKRRPCFDRLDKVYALIGLSDSILTIDYDRSNIELFCAVLLSLKVSLELDFVSMLAHSLDVSAFEYHHGRRSLIKDVPSIALDQSATDIVGQDCQKVYSVKAIASRSELTDIIQSRFGLQKLDYYRVVGQQDLDRMKEWTDFPAQSAPMPKFYGHTPGTVMPIVDGFDLSDTSFRAAMFINPTSKSSQKAVFGMVSTDYVQDGDILVTEPSMYSGILVRISGLSKTWLTVIGVVLFARRVSVESQFSSPLIPTSPTSTVRSATLSDFCERTYPTPFAITACDNKEHFTLRPKDVQLKNLFGGTSTFSGRESRSTTYSSTTSSSLFARPSTVGNDRRLTTSTRGSNERFTSKSDRLERFLEFISIHKRSHSK
ncbi:protein phosphatase regulator [Neophaeococcomyces mojaviensis]|uniref:Protein phosphatase regulator n=1 Tax=Neophaeococcomyces mojaviensis TaxID=3383035 RepID=A0ACC3AJ72_9EURO|nr:protein phosphatase regulator [Knufia sp. JES_112]